MKSTFTKYIDIDSSYRDRTRFPNPMQFDVDMVNRSSTVAELNNPHCFYIELTNIILPNETLTSGGTLPDYPYIYVQLSSMNSIQANTILSNNPNATQCIFKVPIDNVVTVATTNWFILNSCNMIQNLYFKPDSFSFSVFLPDGTLLQTVASDTTPPTAVTATLQVSATFRITRDSDC